MATLIIGSIFGYLVIGFITTVLIHKYDSRFERGDEYDAVFTTLAWPVFWFAWLCMLVLWPIAKFYEKLFGL